MTPTTQGERAAVLIATTRALDVRALTIRDTTPAAALARRPSDAGWSIEQVFEHLCIATDDYLVVLRRLLANPPARSYAASRWKPSLAGRLLVRSFESSRKLPAPKMWRPAPTPRPNVVEEVLARQRELVERGLFAAARFEYDALRHALKVLDTTSADVATKREIDFLRAQERKLGETIRAWQSRETR